MTNNEARERLIKIICEGCKKGIESIVDNCDGELADCKVLNNVVDALLAEGVILPKFKIGQEVWVAEECFYFKRTIGRVVIDSDLELTVYRMKETTGYWSERYIFATEAEAQKALEDKK